jgi:hypothetical protein
MILFRSEFSQWGKSVPYDLRLADLDDERLAQVL